MSNPTDHDAGGSDPAFFKGSFFIYLLFVPAFLLIILAILMAMQYKQLKTFVAPLAVQLSNIPASPMAEERAVQKVRNFFADDKKASEPDTLALSPLEINYLLRSSKSLSDLKLDYHMSIHDTLLVAHNSLPVEKVNNGFLVFLAKILRIKGYLNSEMRGYITLAEGKITIVPISATMNGVPAPVSVLNRKGGFDPGEWIEDKDLYSRAIKNLTSIKIRNNSLIFYKTALN